uniref:Restriction endonuclease n=1 Tax=Candidatus Kentrum sp. FM TaxID=2126340 RepID=A0A450S1X5_9GAMM|nr:MAG: Putative restriction endonuclease [Candidatus Kentron sp. FM]VFJ45643.1 MAG: Putative restriction endonuclease [Candidatus Kentron sp. FM]VFK06819.1 MAG: Putative restriction endonuclease [Candidatus Kentron sp. FM]
MNWQQLCDSPRFRDLPFKIELADSGKIVMSPVKVIHSVFQGEIAATLRTHRKDGRILSACAIETGKGVKVADVAWASKATYQAIRGRSACQIAPELCIEVLSDSNTPEEIEEKKALYFEQGAVEVWLCTQEGEIEHFGREGAITTSFLFPDFRKKMDC